jgi:hypothetical protein
VRESPNKIKDLPIERGPFVSTHWRTEIVLTIREGRDSRTLLRFLPLAFLLTLLLTPAAVRAQKSEGFDEYKIRCDAAWFYSYPSGTMGAQSDAYPVDLTKDPYSTFAGTVDWKFTHKNHFYVVVIPLWSPRTTTLGRDIVWDGNPVHAGAVVQGELHAFEVAPGYRFRGRRKQRNAQ